MQRCKRCGQKVDYSTGACVNCGLSQRGSVRDPDMDTEMTGLELWGIRAKQSLRRLSNRVAVFEHKTLVAMLVLAVAAIIILTAVTSCPQ